VTLTWQSADTQSCSATGAWSGPKGTSGSETVGPLMASGSFVLSCSGAGGTAEMTFAFTVAPAPPAGPIAPAPLPDTTTPGAVPASARTFSFGFGHDVQDIESDAARGRVYLSFLNSIVVLSSDTYLVERVVPVGASPKGIALSSDGSRLYVALANGGSVAILDTDTFQKTTVEVAVDVGTPFIWDVIEVRPGVVLASGYCSYLVNCNAYLVTVDTNHGNAVTRVADGRRVWNGPALRLSHDMRYVYLDGWTRSGPLALRLDNTSPDLPVDLESATTVLGPHFELNTSDTMIMTGGGSVVNAADFSRLLSGIADGVIGYDSAGSEMATLRGSELDVLDAETLELKERFTTDCPMTSVDLLRPAGVRGEWLLAQGANEICVVSTTAPAERPGVDGSRQFSTVPTQRDLPTVETFVGRVPGGLAADFGRNLIYVSSALAGGILAVDTTIGGVIGFLPIPGQPGEIAVSADGARLLVGTTEGGAVVVVDLATWTVEGELDLEPLLGPFVERLVEIDASRWLAKGRHGASSPAAWVLFDPSRAVPAARIGDPRGYCEGTGFVSNDRRYLYLSAPGCETRIEKRDLTAPDWPVVAASDPTHGLVIFFMSESADGTRLYVNGRTLNPVTLTQTGAFEGGAMMREVPNSNVVLTVNGATVTAFDRNTFDRLAWGTGSCLSYEAGLSYSHPVLWPDFSRAAILGLGSLYDDGGTCVMDIAAVLP
jgi:hypothetical protein